MNGTEHQAYVLPPNVVSKVDLSRLVSELEWIDGELTAYAIRAKNNTPMQLPVLSQGLSDFLLLNKLDIKETKARSAVVAQLRALKAKAPIIHMTFAVSADRASLQQLVDWLRREVNPHALIAVGLQPDLVAGVYIRTPNHVRDLSLRAKLKGQHGLLTHELDDLREKKIQAGLSAGGAA